MILFEKYFRCVEVRGVMLLMIRKRGLVEVVADAFRKYYGA